jgi:DNA polymerase III sliding clamp (beta) subunit (PCNA family)
MRVANGKHAAAKKKVAGSENEVEPTPTTVKVSEQRMLPLQNLAQARGTTVEHLVGTLIDDLLARPESVQYLAEWTALHPVAPGAEVAVAPETVEEYAGPPRVVFQTNELKHALSQLKGIINRAIDNILGGDVYGHVRIFAEDGAVKITGVDGVFESLTITIKSGRAAGDVDLVVPFDKLNATVATITAPETVIIQMTTGATLNSGGFSASTERLPAYQFTALPIFRLIAEKPECPVGDLGLAGLKRQFKDVEYATKKSDGKFEDAPVNIESTSESLRVVATDTRRLAISEVPQDAGDFTLTVPKTALEALTRLTGERVTVYESEDCFYFVTELETLTHNKIHGEFPAYQRVVPKSTDGTTKVVVDRDAFLSALKRAKMTADAETPVGILSVSDATTLSLRSELIGYDSQAGDDVLRASSDAALEAIVTGPPVDACLNIDMLLPFVERAAGLITFYVKNNVSVFDFYNGNIRFLQMPCNPALCGRWADRQAEKLRRQAEAEAAAAITAVSVAFPYDEPGFAEVPEVIMEEDVAA